MSIKRVHRWLGLGVAIIWSIQAVTGALSVFRWELDDASVAGAYARVDLSAVGRRIDAIDAAPGAKVLSVWTSGARTGRFDVSVDVDGSERIVRIDGRGRLLRTRRADWLVARGAIWDTISSVHTSLFAGELGEWIIALSGILLLSNIVLALKLAWPRRGTWIRTIFASPKGGPSARLYGWHRKIGLWFALPALFTVSAGTAMAFDDGLERMLSAELRPPPSATIAASRGRIGSGQALQMALARFPHSAFSGLSMPADDTPWFRIRVRNPGEVPRKWGASTVFVESTSGRLIFAYDASAPTPARALLDTLYPLHTGQIGGWAGRILVLAVGFLLIALIALGFSLLWVRRQPSIKRGMS